MTKFVEKYFKKRNFDEKKIDLQSKHSRTLEIINKLLKFNNLQIIQSEKTFLDIGCGDGSLVDYLNTKGINASGCDINDLNFEKDFFPYKDASFDYILMYSVIEHINNTEHLMSEIRRMLKHSGILIIITPNFKYCFNTFYDDPTHIKPFTNIGLENILKIYDFKNILVKPWTANHLNFICIKFNSRCFNYYFYFHIIIIFIYIIYSFHWYNY